MDRGAWWATVHGVTKNGTCLKQLSMRMCRDISHLETRTWISSSKQRLVPRVTPPFNGTWSSEAAVVSTSSQCHLLLAHFRLHDRPHTLNLQILTSGSQTIILPSVLGMEGGVVWLDDHRHLKAPLLGHYIIYPLKKQGPKYILEQWTKF